jgi:UDP-hydrolysing UDP-N-acetyl-D-glucosamine 2-epimerase
VKRKVGVVLTVRGNYAKTKSVLKAIKQNPNLELQLIVGGATILPKFGNPITLIEADGFQINEKVHFLLEGETLITMAKSAGLAIIELATTFGNLKPDIVVAIADRFEALSIAMTAAYMNIPVAHLEGGEISGSIDESIRHAITKLSHLHFVATELSRQRVIKMGEEENRVFVTGSPSLDIFAQLDTKLDFDIFEKYHGVGHSFDISRGYLVAIQHPVTTEYDAAFLQVNQTLEAVYELDMPTLWLWPNMDAGADDISKGIRIFREKKNPQKIYFFKNFSIEDYAKILNNCSCLVGNSSSGIRECAFLGTPVVNIGTRQGGRERGRNVIDVGYNKEEIKAAIKKQLSNGRYKKDYLYGAGNAGEKIADILGKADITAQKRLGY